MVARASDHALSAEQFLRIDFGPGIKAELDGGAIRMMAGGTVAHSRVQMNLYGFLRQALRGSGCRPCGSDAGVQTHPLSVGYPDVTIECGQPAEDAKVLAEPRVIIEVLSPSTRKDDLGVKLNEYRELASVDTIAFVDPDTNGLRVLQRTGPADWTDRSFADPADLALPSLGLVVPYDEIFATD